MIHKTVFCAALLATVSGTALAESGFLSDYSQLQLQQSSAGTDRIFVSPKGVDVLTNYGAIMVDEPEVHFSPDSEYKGLKAEDVASIAAELRVALTDKMTAGGYNVVDQRGEHVLFLRTAVSGLYLKKKKRGLMSYTPVGAVAHAGKNALSETLEKVDIIEMALEAELSDSQTGEVFGAAVLQRGAQKSDGQKEQRMDMDEFRATVQEYSSRFRCRFDNSRVAPEKRIDCYDVAVREAREQN